MATLQDWRDAVAQLKMPAALAWLDEQIALKGADELVLKDPRQVAILLKSIEENSTMPWSWLTDDDHLMVCAECEQAIDDGWETVEDEYGNPVTICGKCYENRKAARADAQQQGV